MAIPLSTWALVAGVASAVTVVFGRALFNPEVPGAIVSLFMWAALFATQAASWALSRKRPA
jgi:hypothetical protein